MLAPLATLAFLTILWLVARVALEVADGGVAKIVAALRGRSMLAFPPQSVPALSVRFHPRAAPARRALHVQPEWRAAA